MTHKPFFAEVIEGALSSFKVLCWEWNNCAPFGAIVIAEKDSLALFGIVSSITTGSSDPTRQPFAYQKTEKELLRDHPHIFEFLQTTFTCKIIGFKQDSKNFKAQLPPQPAGIHTFVRLATAEEQALVFQTDTFLYLLCSELPPTVADELILAVVRHKTEITPLSNNELTALTQNFASLVDNDYQRLKLFLKRLQQD